MGQTHDSIFDSSAFRKWINIFCYAVIGYMGAVSFVLADSNGVRIGDIPGGTLGSGKPAEQIRAIGDFDTVHLDSSADLKVRHGSVYRIRIKADDNLLSLIKTERVGKTLHIYTQGSYATKLGLSIEIDMPYLRALKQTGSGDVALFDIKQSDLQIESSGSGDIVATGAVTKLIVRNEGSSDVDFKALKASDADIFVTGSGDGEYWVTRTFNVRLTGSGDIAYRGSPKMTSVIEGSGEVAALE